MQIQFSPNTGRSSVKNKFCFFYSLIGEQESVYTESDAVGHSGLCKSNYSMSPTSLLFQRCNSFPSVLPLYNPPSATDEK